MATNSYSSLCDDFYMDMYIYTELDLPMQRDTVLAFFERVQKQFPSMGRFYRRENSQYCLQEDCEAGRYRWISLEIDRIGSGVVNPANLEDDAYCQDRLILELSPYMLSLSHLDISSLDISFTMDFDCAGNHDEVIAEALLSKSAFGCLLDTPSVRLIGFSPTIAVALSDDGCTQARISVESKTNVLEDRRQSCRTDFCGLGRADEAISLSLTIRQYPNTTEKFDTLKSFEHQCQLAEELMVEKVIPNLVLPLTATIAQKRLT
jgi:hypothetical protein